ncbi:MAG: helix-turn-helix domain-containing protein [Rubrivivax sp.]|nr:helix-turn-helix domain-containing protein [Rubrivivax sp.]
MSTASLSPRPRPRQRPAPARLPAYALYGEGSAAALPDHVHCESIAERSRLHDWEIRPHQHEALAQVLWLDSGRAEAWLDGRQVPLQGPALVCVPALTAHGFRFAPPVQGWVFTLPQSRLESVLERHPGLAGALLRPQAGALPAGDPMVAAVAAAARQLHDEALADAPWRGAAVDAALLALAVAVARRQAAVAPARAPAARHAAPSPRAWQHVQRLKSLVETQFRQHPSQAALAAQLGITPTQLNRACRQVLGRPALHVLHARLLLQAQRELAYTGRSIKQVAFGLGFTDAAYFTRFFRRLAGSPPAAWRAAQREVPAAQV